MSDAQVQTLPEQLQGWVGKQGVSGWHVITQKTVNEYAALTGDGEGEWVHLDPDRAAREPGFGGTIVPGFLQVAHLTRLCGEAVQTQGGVDVNYALNYGFDRLRFVKQMPVGAKFRARVEAVNISQHVSGGFILKQQVKLELGDGTPTLVAEWLFYLDPRALAASEGASHAAA